MIIPCEHNLLLQLQILSAINYPDMKNKLLICPAFIMGILLMIIPGCQKSDAHNDPSVTVTDIDGNIYNTITIGTQVWMKENLKTTRYRTGELIPNVTDPTQWYNIITGAYCDYDNNPVNSATYGRLYNWYAVNSGNLAPAGWHIPSDAEWVTLENYLGDASLAGGKLKETGTTHWQSPNTAASNETGFTGLPGGYRSSTGSYYEITYKGVWWTSTTGTDISYAYYRFLDFNIGFIIRNEDYKVDGYSVRCIRD